MADIPRFLYHITHIDNLESILKYGLGAIAGKGIDEEKAQSNIVYLLEFDPTDILKNIECSNAEIVCNIVELIMGMENNNFVVIQVDGYCITEGEIYRDEDYVYRFHGIIPRECFDYRCFSIVNTKKKQDNCCRSYYKLEETTECFK